MPKISEVQRLKEQLKERDKAIAELTSENDTLRIERDMAGTDHTTGLPNYNKLTAANMQLMIIQAERMGVYVIICYFDIDDFKSINNKFGHPVGDVALHHVARSIKKCLRKSDYLVRKGGDEFIALLLAKKEPTPSLLEERVERFKEAVASTRLDLGGKIISFSTSIGVKKFDYSKDIEEEIGIADGILYKDKADGKKKEKKTSRKKQ